MSEEVSFRELRFNSDTLLDRVEQGEKFVIILGGAPVADLVPHQEETEEFDGQER